MWRIPARGHPLRVAVGDDAAAAVRVGVLERPVEHVGHGLEPTMRMPRRALRLTRRVLHLAHLVEVDERVEVGQVDARERATDREALALEPGGVVVSWRTGRWRATTGSGSGMRGGW